MTRSAESMPTPGEANAVRLLVVEDHPLFRDALVGVIATAFPNAEVFQATSIDGALVILASKGSVDIILLDFVYARHDRAVGSVPRPCRSSEKRAGHCFGIRQRPYRGMRDGTRHFRLYPEIDSEGRADLIDPLNSGGGGLCPEALP